MALANEPSVASMSTAMSIQKNAICGCPSKIAMIEKTPATKPDAV